MSEIYQNYGMNDVNKYQLPGIKDSSLHSLHRRGFLTWKNFKNNYQINERDTEYNESSIRPDGSEIKIIPIRWINKLEDPNLTSTDLIRSVIMMYECSLNYKEKQDVIPVIETLTTNIGSGFFSSGSNATSD
jgi:hypothetical protein